VDERLQLAKTVLAAVIAWVVAVHVLHVSQAFLAPWAALLTVQATVVGTLKRGVQQAAASVIGVLLAFAAGSAFGVGAVSLGLAILAGLLAGSVRGLRSETTTARRPRWSCSPPATATTAGCCCRAWPTRASASPSAC
jgi:hypothetical protein